MMSGTKNTQNRGKAVINYDSMLTFSFKGLNKDGWLVVFGFFSP